MDILYRSPYASDAIEQALRAGAGRWPPLVVARAGDDFVVTTRAEVIRQRPALTIVYTTDGEPTP